jgi:hypothetical protein
MQLDGMQKVLALGAAHACYNYAHASALGRTLPTPESSAPTLGEWWLPNQLGSPTSMPALTN